MAQSRRARTGLFFNNMVWYIVGFFDYLNTSGIYSNYVTQAMLLAFRQSLQFIFFPIYLVNTAIYVVTSIINLLLDRHEKTNKIKTENLIRLIVNICTLLIVGTAVIGGLLFAATMGISTTILFVMNLAMTGIYNFVGAGYHLRQFLKKGRLLKDPNLSLEDKEKLKKERGAHLGSCIGYAAVGVTIVMVALGGGLAVLGGFYPLAGIGIASGILGAGFCIYGIIFELKKRKQQKKEEAEENPNMTQIADLPKKPKDTRGIFQGLANNISKKVSGMLKAYRETTEEKSTEKKPKDNKAPGTPPKRKPAPKKSTPTNQTPLAPKPTN